MKMSKIVEKLKKEPLRSCPSVTLEHTEGKVKAIYFINNKRFIKYYTDVEIDVDMEDCSYSNWGKPYLSLTIEKGEGVLAPSKYINYYDKRGLDNE
jgi:hypothetical protein